MIDSPASDSLDSLPFERPRLAPTFPACNVALAP
jgi:hypothetical protein